MTPARVGLPLRAAFLSYHPRVEREMNGLRRRVEHRVDRDLQLRPLSVLAGDSQHLSCTQGLRLAERFMDVGRLDHHRQHDS